MKKKLAETKAADASLLRNLTGHEVRHLLTTHPIMPSVVIGWKYIFSKVMMQEVSINTNCELPNGLQKALNQRRHELSKVYNYTIDGMY